MVEGWGVGGGKGCEEVWLKGGESEEGRGVWRVGSRRREGV